MPHRPSNRPRDDSSDDSSDSEGERAERRRRRQNRRRRRQRAPHPAGYYFHHPSAAAAAGVVQYPLAYPGVVQYPLAYPTYLPPPPCVAASPSFVACEMGDGHTRVLTAQGCALAQEHTDVAAGCSTVLNTDAEVDVCVQNLTMWR